MMNQGGVNVGYDGKALFTSTATILVLYILLVIVLRTF